MKKFDVIIIGSGLSGLQCGFILSKEGYNVCILEQHKQIGGCLQNFSREGCIFDTGIHYIGGLDDGQSLNRYFKYFGLMDKLKLKRLDNDAFDIITFENDPIDYKYAMGHDNYAETLSRQFPSDRAGLYSYIHKINEMCNYFPLYNLEYKNFEISEMNFFSENAYDYINSITNNQKLRNVLAATNPLYAGIPDKTPLYVHALVNNSFIESSYRVVDGSSMIADVMADEIRKQGGKIMQNSRVDNFIFENNTLNGVKLSNGEVLHADKFISSIHPAKTLEMIEENHLRKAYRERIMNLENTTSNFTLYVVFNPDSFEYLNHNQYYYKKDDVWLSHENMDEEWPYNFLLITPATSHSGKYADCATIMAYMDMKDVKKWENTTIGKRGEDYVAFKKQKTEQILNLVEHRFPHFRKAIKKCYSSSPLTYRDYTGTVGGSLYGILKNCNEPLKTLISPKTKIPNLLLTGQNIILHGVLGVTIGSVTTCSELLGLEYLVKKIRNAS
ncbi:MAG: NAD(P)/FAD-dependent oxidoreductase [Bacteroidota bacterium]